MTPCALRGRIRVASAADITVISGTPRGRRPVHRGPLPASAAPKTGTITFDGQTLTSDSTPRDRARQGFQFVPQGRCVFGQLSAAENLAIRAEILGRGLGLAGAIKVGVGVFPQLRGNLHAQAGTLSGGEQRMVAIASGLAARPRVLLLDEPSEGLSSAALRAIMGTLRTSASQEGTIVLIAEQRLAGVIEYADAVHVVSGGSVSRALESRAWPSSSALANSVIEYWSTGLDAMLDPPMTGQV